VVDIFHASGVPETCLTLSSGDADVGAALIGQQGVAGVAFTGSTKTARAIARALAVKDGPIIPLIAETGGINAMIVDSTALPEQVVDDVIISGFRSAGQRCSALRLLFLPDAMFDPIIQRLIGAMKELRLGDPRHIETDIGPVIDSAAKQRLEAYSANGSGRSIFRLPIEDALRHGHFVAPELRLLDSSKDLRQEIFGPIVHIVRYPVGEIDAALGAINSLGYGLTLGVHSRLDRTIRLVRERARVGNLYINRSMIGAVVGVQPFGGEGLSGTGMKAGGPHYLLRFTTERTFTQNLTAAGGDIRLLSSA
jgi:RHH-type proline utilization regulon transcriptional repressor/proline dehydrogenase/delta 1-pyrroline-5-carboxylate dehydrogenase